MNTLTIQDFHKVLCSNGIAEIKKLYVDEFIKILDNQNNGRPMRDLTSIIPTNYKQAYYQIGLQSLKPVFDKMKKLTPNDIPLDLGFLAGILENEVLIGIDKTGGTPYIALYTTNEDILRYLATKGAFSDLDKFEKDLKQLQGTKKVNAFKNNNTVAMGRIDFESLEGDIVNLKFTLPRSVREDFGTTFLIYPYSSFAVLAEEFKKFANNKKALTVHQIVERITKDNRSVEQKTRKLTFLPKVVEASYGKAVTTLDEVDEIKSLIESKIAKCDCSWDPTRLLLRAYDLESSLYGKSYTNIRFQDIIGVENCPPSSIDTSQYTVNYEDLRSLFKTRINSWRLKDYQSFTIVPTDGMATISDRKDFLLNWLSSVDDSTLYKIMTSHPELFDDVEEGLKTKYRMKPRAEKLMRLVKLSNNMDERVNQVRDYLSKGICKIEAVSKKGSNRTYIATTNEDILEMKLGKNYLWKFESDRNKLNALMDEVDRGIDKESFEDLVYKGDLSGIVPLHKLGSGSEAEMKALLEEALGEITPSSRSNPYLVNFKQPYAETRDDFWGAVDVRRIESFEFGDISLSKKK